MITVEEAILVHLLEYRRHFVEEAVPLEMTQAGISRAIGVRRSHVSSSLDSTKVKGHVEEVLAHIKGEARRRKSYVLSNEGAAEAENIRARLAETQVTAKLPGSEDFHGSLSDLLSLPEVTASMARAALLTFDGVVNLPSAISGKTSESEWKCKIPQAEPFLGREGELAELKNFFDSQMAILAVYGIPGIGKSALAAEAIARHGDDFKIFWFSISEWSSPRNTATHLSDFLVSTSFTRLRRYLDAHEVPDLADLRDILMEVESRCLFVFDDCHNSSQSMLRLLKMLASVSIDSGFIKLILISRKKLDIGLVPETPTLNLDGLDMSSCVDILIGRGFGTKDSEQMAGRSGGHPLYLTLVEKFTDRSKAEDVSGFLAKEIIGMLMPAEKEVMFSLSAFRKGIRTDAIAIEEEHLIALETLESKHLVWRSDGWRMHALLKDYFYEHQSNAGRGARHERAAEYYNAYTADIPGEIEEAYHLFKASDSESALLLFGKAGPEWLKHGYLDEIIQLSAFIPDGYEDAAILYDATILVAEVLAQVGEWAKATPLFEHCIDLAKEQGDGDKLSAAMQRKGTILYRKGSLDAALSVFQDALYGGLSPALEAKLNNSLGVVHWRMGEIDKARAAYETDLFISEKTNDLQGLARALNNIGILDWQDGNNDDALEKYARALDSAERMSDKKLIAILYSNIADAYKSKGNNTEARRFYERCLALSEDLKFNWQVAEAYRGLADLVEDRDTYLNKALAIFERLGAKEDAKAVRVMMN